MEDRIRKDAYKQAVHKLRCIDARDFWWDTCLLDGTDWTTLAAAFTKANAKEHRNKYDVIRAQYARGTIYTQVCELKGPAVQAVTTMLHRALQVLCRRVERWGGDRHALMIHIARELDPFGAGKTLNGPLSLKQRQRALYRAFSNRAQLQLQLHWQHSVKDATDAATKTFEALFSNSEICTGILSASRRWVRAEIDKRFGKLYTERARPATEQAIRPGVEAHAVHAQEPMHQTGHTHAPKTPGEDEWLRENYRVTLNEASQTGLAVAYSYETFRAEQFASGTVDGNTGRMPLPVREFIDGYSRRHERSDPPPEQASVPTAPRGTGLGAFLRIGDAEYRPRRRAGQNPPPRSTGP